LDASSVAALLSVIQTLQQELESRRHETAQARAETAEARAEIRRLVEMVEGLTRQLDALLRDRNDERRAELAKVQAEARAVAEAHAASAADEDVAPLTPPSDRAAPNRSKHGRGALPPQLERNTKTEVPPSCRDCGGVDLEREKVLVTEELDYVRAHLRVRRTERVVCRCRTCLARTTADAPPMPFDRASCTMALLAWLCYAKVGLFLPLDRLRRDFADQGVTLASSKLTRWWQRGPDLLLPIAQHLRLSLLAGDHVRTDGTGLLVVFPRQKANPVKGPAREGEVEPDGFLVKLDPVRGQILVFGDDRHAVYVYTPTKEGHHALDFFTLGHDEEGKPIRWKGTVTADALNAHDCLFVDDERVESGCNAHGLRKFRDDADKAPLLAGRALAYIGRFYAEEAKAREQGLTGAELLAWRQSNIAPITREFRLWLDEHRDDLLPDNPVYKAMNYYIKHWDALTRFLEDPDVPLDNNWSERALRSVNLIRNNSLFAGGEEGAVRLCTLLTLVSTCRLIGVDPFSYLEWALTRVVPHRANRGLTPADLTPHAYQAAQQAGA
ncbi:MAG: IS66 family transposase, partial [Sandaracinaceae bacterium]|nr:IS66 family transposase [Sandaracinaceae bacterium]